VAADPGRLIDALVAGGVEFVVIGGVALVLHGSARTTGDLDVCYSRSAHNLAALEHALAPFHPTLRGAPSDLPFRLDAATLRAGLNFTLSTTAGDLDLLGEVAGVGAFADVARDAVTMGSARSGDGSGHDTWITATRGPRTAGAARAARPARHGS